MGAWDAADPSQVILPGRPRLDATRDATAVVDKLGHLCVVGVVVSAALLGAQEPDGLIEWPYVGAQQSHTKYSPAAQITRENVDQLQIAWEWKPNEMPMPERGARPGSFQATPIMIDNVLYLSTMYNRVVALDAETGEELWVFDSKAYEREPRHGFKHRGVAYRRDGDDVRIFLNSRNRLYAIDARTGQAVSSFGEAGSVSLTEGHGRPVDSADFDQTSPPVVFEDLVIVGNRVPDWVIRRFDPPGTIQAYDARTGERRSVFYTIPQSTDDFGADTWEGESWRYTGHANVWGLMSVDEERRLLYVPTSTPSGDYWGGRRLGANLFAESLVCLDARTGERPMALPGGTPRGVGLRPQRSTESRDDHGRWADNRRSGRGLEAGVHVCIRPGDRRACVADRGTPGGHDELCTRGGALSDSAVSNQTAAVQPTRGFARGCQRHDPRDPCVGGRGDAAVSDGALVHATESARDAAAAHRAGRRRLGWRLV